MKGMQGRESSKGRDERGALGYRSGRGEDCTRFSIFPVGC